MGLFCFESYFDVSKRCFLFWMVMPRICLVSSICLILGAVEAISGNDNSLVCQWNRTLCTIVTNHLRRINNSNMKMLSELFATGANWKTKQNRNVNNENFISKSVLISINAKNNSNDSVSVAEIEWSLHTLVCIIIHKTVSFRMESNESLIWLKWSWKIAQKAILEKNTTFQLKQKQFQNVSQSLDIWFGLENATV